VDPQLYLTQLLINLSQVRKSELINWLPNQWKLLQAARASGVSQKRPLRVTSKPATLRG
jgi:hypothetical protein